MLRRQLEDLLSDAFGTTNVQMQKALEEHGADAEVLRRIFPESSSCADLTRDANSFTQSRGSHPDNSSEMSLAQLRQIGSELDEALDTPPQVQVSVATAGPSPPTVRPPNRPMVTRGRKDVTWLCDLCGTQNSGGDVVARVLRRGCSKEAEDVTLTCAGCRFRPKTV